MTIIKRWILERAADGGVLTRDIAQAFGVTKAQATTHIQNAKHRGLLRAGEIVDPVFNVWRWVATDAGRAWLRRQEALRRSSTKLARSTRPPPAGPKGEPLACGVPLRRDDQATASGPGDTRSTTYGDDRHRGTVEADEQH